MASHLFALRRARPARPAAAAGTSWGRLEPVGGRSWLDLLPRSAPEGLRVLYALLDAGMLEAWQDAAGHVRLRAPRVG